MRRRTGVDMFGAAISSRCGETISSPWHVNKPRLMSSPCATCCLLHRDNPAWPAVSEKYEALLSPAGAVDLRVHDAGGIARRGRGAIAPRRAVRARYLDVVVDEHDSRESAWRSRGASKDDHLYLYVIGEAGLDTAVKIGMPGVGPAGWPRSTPATLAGWTARPRRQFERSSLVSMPAWLKPPILLRDSAMEAGGRARQCGGRPIGFG